ncbi:MAG TPA: 2-succinyl-5-enolpyruvyl-6-hydroxy-3-cyclohexene-1-carboxylic-acid synthase [Streptosporangiaceae bacterium]
MNPSTAFATVLVDELIRCGLREAVIAPGSRSAPLAMALHAACDESRPGSPLRLHVRIDERSAAFLALGLAKASGRPVAVVCTSGTAAAHFHGAVVEADEAAVPLLVLTADRPPELRGTGANQTIDQIKLYGSAVRWFCEVGVPEDRPGQVEYWRSLTCRAWSLAYGNGPVSAGPVHLNLPFRDPLVPDLADPAAGSLAAAYQHEAGQLADPSWHEPLAGRPGVAPWTRIPAAPAGSPTQIDWTERGLVVCGDGATDPAALAELAAAAGWPLLAEPSSGARHGRAALRAYEFLLETADFARAHRPDLIISAGRPGLSRGQLALLRGAGPWTGDEGGGGAADPAAGSVRHIVVGRAADGRWADPARSAAEVADSVRLRGVPPSMPGGWLQSWLTADTAAAAAAEEILRAESAVSEPLLAREVAAGLPAGGLLWAAASMPARDLDRYMAPRPDIRILASRGASGIDGTVSAAIGAALAHQRAGGGTAVALLGDLALLHDAPGLMLGPEEPRPDLCLVVVNNDGGGIFSTLEQVAFPGPFERVFGTPHGANLARLAGAAGLPYARLGRLTDLTAVLTGHGLRLAELQTDRSEQAKLRAAIGQAVSAALGAR